MQPIAAEHFTQNWIVRLLQALRFLVEAGEIELHYCAHAVERLVKTRRSV